MLPRQSPILQLNTVEGLRVYKVRISLVYWRSRYHIALLESVWHGLPRQIIQLLICHLKYLIRDDEHSWYQRVRTCLLDQGHLVVEVQPFAAEVAHGFLNRIRALRMIVLGGIGRIRDVEEAHSVLIHFATGL